MTTAMGMTPADFERLHAIAPDCAALPALRLAMRGERAGTLAWLDWGARDKDRPLQDDHAIQWLNLTLNLIWSANPKYARHEDRAIQKTVQVTPPWIAAMALRRDPGEESDMADGDVFFEIVNFESDQPPRHRWSFDDEAIVRAGIALWRDDDVAIGQFFVALSRFVQHGDFVGIFVDEGINIEGLLDNKQFKKLTDHDQAPECAPIEFMVRTGNFAGVAAVLTALPDGTDPARVHGLAALKDTVDNGSMPYKAIKFAYTHEDLDSGLRVDGSAPDDGFPAVFGPRTQGILDMLNALSRWEGADPSCTDLWRVRMRVLTACLEAAQDNGSLPDPDLVSCLLRDQGPRGGSLIQRLAAAPTDADATLRLQTNRLFLTAATMHQPDVLGLAGPWLYDRPARDLLAWVEALTPARLLRQCALTDRVSGPIDTQALRACLNAIQDFGLDVTGPFDDLWHSGSGTAAEDGQPGARRNSFLHALASSRHPQSLPALLVALEVGCDPAVRNHVKRTAASTVSPKEMKTKWRSIEASFAAKVAAEQELRDIGCSAILSPSA